MLTKGFRLPVKAIWGEGEYQDKERGEKTRKTPTLVVTSRGFWFYF